MKNKTSDISIIVACITVVFLALITAFVVMTTVGNTDPDILLRFIAGPAIGNLLSVGAVTYLTIVNRKVSTIGTKLKTVEENTNGTSTRIVDENIRLTNLVHDILKKELLREQVITDERRNSE